MKANVQISKLRRRKNKRTEHYIYLQLYIQYVHTLVMYEHGVQMYVTDLYFSNVHWSKDRPFDHTSV